MKVMQVGLISVLSVLLLTMGGCMTPEQEEAMCQKDEIITNQDKEIARLTKAVHDMQSDYGMAVKDRNAYVEQLNAANEALLKMQAANKDAGTPANNGMWKPRDNGSISVTVLDDVLFAPGKFQLTNEKGKSELAKIADSIKKHYPDYMVRVEGYTDSDPINKSKDEGVMEDNMDLSYWRAKSVYEELTKNKISDRMMTIGCYADTAPKATKAESRRVEIVVLPKLKASRAQEAAAAPAAKSTVVSKK